MTPASFALWNLGFRPFYLLAGIFAALSIPLWVCQYASVLPAAYLPAIVWHGHEMLFGYTLAYWQTQSGIDNAAKMPASK